MIRRTLGTDDIYCVEIRFKLPFSVVRAMKLHSKKYKGLKRPNEGSVAHFGKAAILRELKRIGADFEAISDGEIRIPVMKSGT